MKKIYYYHENIENPVEICQKDDFDTERRKQLSIETNRRRREMAIKVKREIEKEEKRRKEILKQRKEYQNNLNEKLHRRSAQRCAKTTSVQHLTASDLDRTLNVLRSNAPTSSLKLRSQSSEDLAKYNNRLESAWSDNREVCASPMTKYSGPDSGNRHRDNDYYLKTFETKLLEQEEAFRQRQNVEMSNFTKVLDDTVIRNDTNKKFDTVLNEIATYRVDRKVDTCGKDDVIENIEDECGIEDSLEIDAKISNEREMKVFKVGVIDSKKVMVSEILKKEKKSDKIDEVGSTVVSDNIRPSVLSSPHPVSQSKDDSLHSDLTKFQFSRESSSQPFTQTTIKSILKKGFSNRFGSNPDIAGSDRSIDIRDSLEVTKTRSSKLFRSSSFSHGINDLHDKSSAEEDAAKKFVRFAEDASNSQSKLVSQPSKPPLLTDSARAPPAQKVHKTFTVPGSTPLKPPLHPRSTQEGSYLQGTLKRNAVYQAPQRPRKISVEILDKQLEPLIHPKRPQPIPVTMIRDGVIEKQDDTLLNISLDKTPTENEIEQLWAEVRECLSKSRTTTKPESVGPISGRTIDSGSDVSIRSAPSWQRSSQRGAPFQVRHHRPWSSRQAPYPGQESPIRNEITVHGHNDSSPVIVSQQPLNVLGHRDQDFQAVSESMEEFLSIEGTCSTPNSRRLNSTLPAGTTPVFLPRPPSNTRIRTQPIRWHLNNESLESSDRRKYSSYITDTSNNVPSTQLSLDEDKVKKSLDRLNDRLKNMTTFV